ncbi:MAG: UDP-N-acetylmuramoyl-L-alanine--D-glutamate ligase [Wenzhouxiangella sp.]
MRLEQLCQLRIGVLGYGREGRSAVSALLAYRPDVDLTVLVESGETPDQARYVSGPFDEKLQNYQVLLRSPGVRINHPALVAYRNQGGLLINPASIWFSERPELTVAGVTGSKGKSTTASILAHLLRGAGRDVLLAGNIGIPLLDHLNTTANVVVAELSSYQLADLQGKLSLGIMTRLFDEHLDWHGNQLDYFFSKLRLADLLEGSPLVINGHDPVLKAATMAVSGRIEGNRSPGFHRGGDQIYLDQLPLVSSKELALVGRHNLDNAALAMEAAHLLGCNLDVIVDALCSFRPLPHRLEFIAHAHGRRWVNDSIATSPHATRAALDALQTKPLTLIAGGQERPADWQPVIDWCRDHVLAGLVVLPDNGAAIARHLVSERAIKAEHVHTVNDIEAAVDAAVRQSAPGGTVLLSPGAPSFPHFRDFEQRGDCFRAAVAAYRDRSTA